MDCEVCGKQIYGGVRNVIIDGAKLVVCSECARSTTPSPQTYIGQTTVAKKASSAPKVRQRQVVTRENTVTIHEDLEVVKNYGALVREARERMHLTHFELSRKIGFKISVIQKLETEKMVPEQDLAKKLEYTLKIKLLQRVSRVAVEGEFTKQPSKLTLGDIVFVQKEK